MSDMKDLRFSPVATSQVHEAHTDAADHAFPAVLAGVGPTGLETLRAFDAACIGTHPDTPAWHLVDIGTAPSVRCLGVGGSLIRHRVKRIDTEGTPASLEATTQASGKLYETLGFTHKHTLSGVAEGMSVMWREPQETNTHAR